MGTDIKKVLIVTYYWPPSGGSGVQRWLKFVKYLPLYGWQPHVFTPENPSFDIRDESLIRDIPPEAKVVRLPIWEPYETFLWLSRIVGATASAKPTELVKTTKKSFFQKASTWVRANLFVPDPRRFWVRPAVKFLKKYLAENSVNTFITTGPPHSLHLIGLRLKEENPQLTWIADFRDPWSEWGLLDSLQVGASARGRHRRMEREVLTTADHVITITPFYVRRFASLSGRQVQLLTNGFDEDDFRDIRYSRHDKFTIRHVGIVNEKCNPRPFMNAVGQLLAERPDIAAGQLVIEFIGEVHPDFKDYVSSNVLLSTHTTFTGNMPHKQLLQLYGSSDVLMIILTGYKDAEGYMPGKLFEYLATGLPIIGTGPEDGDAARLLNETGAGIMVAAEKSEEIKKFLISHFNEWKTGAPKRPRTKRAEEYSRRSITGDLVKLFH